MNSNLRRKQELLLDGVEESFKFISLTYRRLLDTLCRDKPDKHDTELMNAVMLDCWVIIDHAKRLRTLLEHTPGLRKTPDLQGFLNSANEIPDFRNHIQRVEDQVWDNAPIGIPVWGSVSWFRLLTEEKFSIQAYVPGRLAKCKGVPVVNPAGREIHGDVDHIELSVETQTINISELIRIIEFLAASFAQAIEEADKEGNRDHNGLLRFEVKVPPAVVRWTHSAFDP